MKTAVITVLSALLIPVVGGASVFGPETDRETARLQANRESLVQRKIDLVPVPKHITFQEQVSPEKIAIVLADQAPRRAVIIEELTTRFEELGLNIKPQISAKPLSGAYNIIIADWNSDSSEAKKIPFNENPRFDQAYTLTPVKDGIILSGRKDALYAAVTMRYLITEKDGKAVIYPASVSDWPDFVFRSSPAYSQYLLEFAGSKDPEKYLKRIRPVVRFLLHHKINVASGVVRSPYKPSAYWRSSFGTKEQLRNTRLAADYAEERGIRLGFIQSTPALGYYGQKGGDKDALPPGYQKMMHVPVHREYVSWAYPEMHREKAEKFAGYVDSAKTGIFSFHAVDTGGALDPEQWSQRDEATRKMFGDDRAKADATLINYYAKAVKNPNTIFSLSQYPYTAEQLEPEKVRIRLGLPDNAEGRAQAASFVKRDMQFLKDLDRLLDKKILFCSRETNSSLIDLFYSNLPGRPFELAWYTFELNRDIGSLVEPELAAIRGVFRKDRLTGDLIAGSGIAGTELGDPSRVLFAEFSWNSAYPGCCELDRTKMQFAYDAKLLDILTERISSGFFGEKAGKDLKALFDNMFSFYLTVDPSKMAFARRNEFDMHKLMRRNHQQLLKADKAFDAVWAKVKSNPAMKRTYFKPDSYIYFIEYYRLLKAAKIHSAANLATMDIEAAAIQGNLALTERIHQQAQKELAAYKAEYKAKMEELKNEPVRLTFKQSYGWFHRAPTRMTARLLSDDFSAPEKKLNEAWEKRQKIFENSYAPAWYKQMRSRVSALEFPADKPSKVVSWCSLNGVPASRKIEVELSRDKKGLILNGRIWNDKLDSIPVDPQADIWGKDQDSVEFLISPTGTEGKYFQFAFNQDGKRWAKEFILTLQKGEPVTKPYELKTLREKGLWSFSLKIPYEIVGKPTGKMKGLLCCGGTCTGKVDIRKNGSFHDRTLWNPLFFPQKPSPVNCQTTLNPGDITTADKVHSSGAGTAVVLRPEFDCSLPVENAVLSLRILGPDGRELAPWTRIAARSFVPAVLKGSEETEIQLEVKHSDFIIELKADYEFNEKKCSASEKFLYGKNDKNISGLPFDVQGSLNPLKGGISFDFVPAEDFCWKGYLGSRPEVWLFHSGAQCGGSQRPKWQNLISLSVDRRWGTMSLNICDKSFKLRRVLFYLPPDWKPGVKQHLDCEWDLGSEPVRMSIKLNGHTMADKIVSWKGPDTSKLNLSDCKYGVRIGSANNGTLPAKGSFSNITLK